jgi:hypothetical protein
MRIGYCVEGSTDRAFIEGFRRRWCPDAILFEGPFRGTTGVSLRREIPKICQSLSANHCDIIVFLTDSNDQTWHDIIVQQKSKIPAEYEHQTLSGVAERNIECWLTADPEWFAEMMGPRFVGNDFRIADPKGIVERALEISGQDKQEEKIACLVRDAPLRKWLDCSNSFKKFYEDARDLSVQFPCSIPNEREQGTNRCM